MAVSYCVSCLRKEAARVGGLTLEQRYSVLYDLCQDFTDVDVHGDASEIRNRFE
jgi:hypothetical protein